MHFENIDFTSSFRTLIYFVITFCLLFFGFISCSTQYVRMHRALVYGFFRNASAMLRADDKIHVNHKTTAPFNHWNLEELASQNLLALIAYIDFKVNDYLGYNNKRGTGSRCDKAFPLGECSIFKFRKRGTWA